MVVVGSHLWHGIASAFQSLGADIPMDPARSSSAGKVVAVVIAGWFVVIAIWAYLRQAGQVRP